MELRGRPTRAVVAAGVASTALLLAGVPGAEAQDASGVGTVRTAEASKASGATKAIKTVTLVTGDQVMVDGAGKVTGVVRAEGREKVPFTVRVVAGHTRVVPGDAELLLAQGKLDARLFDVTQLVADGYDDARRTDVPLIATFQGKKAPSMAPFTGAGAKIGRALPVVNGKVVRPAKKRAAEFWDAVTGTAEKADGATEFTPSTAIEKLWLDGRVKASLDKSVPQIGAPTAWAAGYDGTGTKVAVLDTGIDTSHPDVASQVIAEQDFTGSPSGASDKFGHGTHVASITAGTGARSGGKYKGVAPGAKILNGKVLDDNGGGDYSGIIAGMEWAVAQGADVVNLSLGGEDTPGIDPLEETVNRLSAQSDTLFVLSAGNEGEGGESTVGSPGSADAALTVGAVDKSDQLGDFSSRGPRVGDGGVKPDLTAPGVAITAAAAAGSVLEEWYPSDVPGYLTLDGTSMAAPHVAGAAAILAQQHPDWTGERIKAVLTGSAEPGAYSSFQQGTGRTDLVRALNQSVVTEQKPLDFGLQQWPHGDDTPATKQVTYRNLGTEPVTLDLSVDALSVDGKPAAEGMFAVSPQRVTVPAGGEASASVTADTRAGTADGSFGGSVTAASADGKVRVRTAVGVAREVESYSLTLKHLDENGAPVGDASTSVTDLNSDFYANYADEQDGELTVRLPKGDYSLSGVIHPSYESATHAILVQPKLTLDRDTSVTIDARKTRPVKITVPDAAAENTEATAHYSYARGEGRRPGIMEFILPTFTGTTFGQLGPEPSAGQASAVFAGDWTREDAQGRPVTYHLGWNRPGGLDGFAAEVRKNQLAKVDLQVGVPVEGRRVQVEVTPHTPDGDLIFGDHDLRGGLPLRTTDYVLDNDVKWSFRAWQVFGEGHDSRFEAFQMRMPRTWQAGHSYTERFNVGVFGPTLPAAGDLGPERGLPGVVRYGNVIRAFTPQFGDGAGHWGLSDYTSVTSSLQADGKEIADDYGISPIDLTEYTVPAQDSAYKLTVDASRDPAVYPVSTRVRTEWTFRSATTPEDSNTALPLSVVRFSPDLSLSSTAKAGQRFSVPFTVEGAAAGQRPAKLAFEVSYDDGATWQHAKAVGGTHLALTHPATAGSVSLRAKLTDRAGNTLVQTIERAYLTTK
ncbi:S8 family serine peptidase [Streptomyces sp. WI04-05B]|uniref:S8 family serine peptidase n=1 Tax=Streptomyces TaxID=1883 RepID=UPI0029AFBBDD|nr:MULTISPECIES: S8 family serine peptidase [unclassified Streptomyces]MDX2543129.1 S8 family serine peptidase [Streptomyces sp. WI04-05B]MDX2584830.1 S8 family serine peptidase [Streptomyces sp. WI04-05A]